MSKRNMTHFHLTHKQGPEAVVRQPEAIVGRDTAQRILDELAIVFVLYGCRVKTCVHGVRVYDCRGERTSEQTFEAHYCDDSQCMMIPEYGNWAKVSRRKYFQVLKGRGLLP